MRFLYLLILILAYCLCVPAHAGIGSGYGSSGCSGSYLLSQIPCVPGMPHSAWTPTGAPAAIPPMPFQGNTPASVEANFPAVINWEFEYEPASVLNTQLAIMTDLDLARFSQNYYVESHGQLGTLMMAAAQKLSAANLTRLAAAFGAWNLSPAVAAYSPVAAEYFATAQSPLIKQSLAHHQSVGLNSLTINGAAAGLAAPNTSMTLYEIYTEYLFTSAQTQLGAMALATKFAYVSLQIAFTVGWTAGGAFYDFATWVDPSYGYDITTTYGDLGASDFGPIDGGTFGDSSMLDFGGGGGDGEALLQIY